MRKRVEEIFGWMKTVGGFRKTRYVGLGANQLAGHMIAAAYDLLRIAKLTEAAWAALSGSPRRVPRHRQPRSIV